MNRVYIVQNPMRRDPVTNDLVNMYDLTPAREFGHLEVLLPSGPVSPDSTTMVYQLMAKLAGFDRSDHLLCLGNPAAIAAASAIVSSITGGDVPLLVYDRHLRKYLSIKLDLKNRFVPA